MATQTGISRAVERMGGIVASAYKLNVTVAAIYKWLALGYVPLTWYARIVSKESGISMEDLAPTKLPKPTAPVPNGRRRGGRFPRCLTGPRETPTAQGSTATTAIAA